MSGYHVIPINDLVEHVDDDCICGPETELIFDENESLRGWVVKHHSLDGREIKEVKQDGGY